MGCGNSSLAGDPFNHISANKAHPITVHTESSYKHDSIYSSLPTSSSDPTKGPYLPPRREEPLRDAQGLPTQSDASGGGHYRKASWHNKGAYHDLTMPGDDKDMEPTGIGGGDAHKDRRGRQVRMQSWSERKHGGRAEPKDPKTGRGLYTDM